MLPDSGNGYREDDHAFIGFNINGVKRGRLCEQ